MQRIALLAGAMALALAGCQAPSHRASLRPPPLPVLSTRPPRVIEPIPPPPRPAPPVSPTPGVEGLAVTPADVQVPGGIHRGRWQVIVVHHSAQRNASPESMDRYHRDIRRWSGGLGYHFVIGNGVGYPDGHLYVGPRWRWQQTGAHCRASAGRYFGAWRESNFFNEHGIGICLIGDFDVDYPTPRQWRTLRDLIVVLVHEAGVSPSQIYGHGEVTGRTACPGRNLDMGSLRRAVAGAVAHWPVASGLPARAGPRY